MFEILRPLYGIFNARDYCVVTVEFLAEHYLNMTPSIPDPSLYVNFSDGKLEGIIIIYVDYNLNSGTKYSEEVTKESLHIFYSKPRIYDEFYFFGIHISTAFPGEFFLSQQGYDKRIAFLPKDFPYTQLRKHPSMLP